MHRGIPSFVARILAPVMAVLAAAFPSPSHAVDLIGYLQSSRMGDTNYVNNVLPAQLALLDEVRYFGITVTSSGGLTTSTDDRNRLQTILQKINGLPADQRPRLGITLGGWQQSSGFAAVARSSSLRATLAQNIETMLDQTGAVGVDIDWEHPAEDPLDNELLIHYPALLSRIKHEVGSERRVYATVSPEKILPRSVFEGADAIDGVSIMTYDLSWWGSDTANPTLGQHSLHQYVVDAANAWTNPIGASIPRNWVFGNKRSIDAPENKLGIGSPFYGRGYNGSNPNDAEFYKVLKASGTTTDGNSYAYQSKNFWLPGPDLLEDRVEFAHQRGLQHMIFWELYHDLAPGNSASLLRKAYDTKVRLAAAEGDFNADGWVDEADMSVWAQGFGVETNASPSAGDANSDGAIDATDFLIWQRGLRAAPTVPLQSAPEPSGAILAVGLGAALLWRRRVGLPLSSR